MKSRRPTTPARKSPNHPPNSSSCTTPVPKPSEYLRPIHATSAIAALHAAAYPAAARLYYTGRAAPVTRGIPNSHEI